MSHFLQPQCFSQHLYVVWCGAAQLKREVPVLRVTEEWNLLSVQDSPVHIALRQYHDVSDPTYLLTFEGCRKLGRQRSRNNIAPKNCGMRRIKVRPARIGKERRVVRDTIGKWIASLAVILVPVGEMVLPRFPVIFHGRRTCRENSTLLRLVKIAQIRGQQELGVGKG